MSRNWRKKVRRLSRNFRGPYAKHSRKFGWKVALNLTRELQNSHKLVSSGRGVAFAAAYFCGDLRATHSPINFSLRIFCAHCRWMHAVHYHPYTKLSRTRNDFQNPLRGPFAEVNTKTKRPSPSILNRRASRTTLV